MSKLQTYVVNIGPRLAFASSGEPHERAEHPSLRRQHWPAACLCKQRRDSPAMSELNTPPYVVNIGPQLAFASSGETHQP